MHPQPLPPTVLSRYTHNPQLFTFSDDDDLGRDINVKPETQSRSSDRRVDRILGILRINIKIKNQGIITVKYTGVSITLFSLKPVVSTTKMMTTLESGCTTDLRVRHQHLWHEMENLPLPQLFHKKKVKVHPRKHWYFSQNVNFTTDVRTSRREKFSKQIIRDVRYFLNVERENTESTWKKEGGHGRRRKKEETDGQDQRLLHWNRPWIHY